MLKEDADNSYVSYRNPGNNRIDGILEAGAGIVIINKSPYSELGWFNLAMTWSDAANDDEAKYFIAGAQVGATSAALNVWGGAALTFAFIGAGSPGPAGPWHGWLSDMMVLDYVATPAQILDLATV